MQEVSPAGRNGPGTPPLHSKAGAWPAPRLDQYLHAALAPLTVGVSPVTIASAFGDWTQHLALSPDKQMELARKTARLSYQYADYCWRAWTDPAATQRSGLPHDRRFTGRVWDIWPFNVLCQGFLTVEHWWQDAATGVHGVSDHHQKIVSFVLRHWLDMYSPASLPAANPEVLKASVASGGGNLVWGTADFIDDWRRVASGQPAADEFEVGRNLAATRGKVIFRNHLIELIQYEAVTDQVRPEPVLIVPAWLMKYYILDLAPGKSLVEYLVGEGHTVFMVSWRNPGPEDCDLGLEEYRQQGIMAALDAVGAVVPGRRIHGAGYCLGGTLLAIAAAAMARDGDDRLASLSLFAAQTDFAERGELMLFIDEAQAAFLEDLMALEGFLDFRRLTGALRLWRTGDLIWSGLVRNYLIGERPRVTEYTAWTLDATRLPARMHSEYLRKLILDNDLAHDRYHAGGRPVSLHDIGVPVFAVSTSADHVAPWRSIYGLHAQTGADITFVLAEGGHNAGIVNPPLSLHRHYRTAGGNDFTAHTTPDGWQAQAPRHDGSWWPFWQGWLSRHSGAAQDPPGMGAPARGLKPLCDAPGNYVLMR
ncbi:MAG: PHA/PHB synthase family protein [Alphaproteobacteria bacterium]